MRALVGSELGVRVRVRVRVSPSPNPNPNPIPNPDHDRHDPIYSADWRFLRSLLRDPTVRTLKPVDTAAALGSGSSASLPFLPQPWARALPPVLCSAASPFEATHAVPTLSRPWEHASNPFPGTLDPYAADLFFVPTFTL